MAKKHIPALDGIRGIAILAVLLTHAEALGDTRTFIQTPALKPFLVSMTFGWAGVDLFFVLSGFLITGILIQTRTAANRAISFYARRFLRIFPIYYLTLAIVLGGAAEWPWLNAVLQKGWADRASYFVYLQNWSVLWGSDGLRLNILGHFWSLAVEEQFYLVWPVIVWMLPDRAVLKVCIAGALCALMLRIGLVSYFGPHLWIDILTPCRGEGLLVGSALAVAATRGRISVRAIAGMAAAGAGLVFSIVFLDHREFTNTDHGPYMYTIGVSGLALLFGALVASSQYSIPGLTRALNWGWLRSFGKYSYGIYVYHIPVFIVLEYFLVRRGVIFPVPAAQGALLVATMVAVSFAIAWLSFTLIEGPLLRLKRRFEPKFPQPKPRVEEAERAAFFQASGG